MTVEPDVPNILRTILRPLFPDNDQASYNHAYVLENIAPFLDEV